MGFISDQILLSLGSFALGVLLIGSAVAQGPDCGDYCSEPFFADQIFTPVSTFSDEFTCRRSKCNGLGRKWIKNNPAKGTGGTNWAGRQPLLFAARNVFKKQNHLTVEAKGFPKNYTRAWNATFNIGPPGSADTFVEKGYNHYTGGFVQATTAVKYGYFESRLKPTKVELVSAFWMSLNTPTKWTEIDVVEACHVSAEEQRYGTDFRRRIAVNAHIFRDASRGIAPGQGVFSANPKAYVHSQDLADGFNNYAVYWSENKIEWFFNGRPFASIPNEYWDQELHPKWTVEANFQWHGVLPDVKALQRTKRAEKRAGIVHGSTEMAVSYIRTWSTEPTTPATTARQSGAKVDNLLNVPQDEAQAEVNPQAKNKYEDFYRLQKAPKGDEVLLEEVSPPAGQSWEEEIEKASTRRRRRR